MHQRRNSQSRNSSPQYRRSWSPQEHRGRQRRSPSFPNSLSPHVLRHPSSHRASANEYRREDNVRAEEDYLLERAVDRRTRRQKQAAREREVAERKREGKKPFYLTLDADGKPYGVGKPAWVHEIRKLATGLDPSCTHIRKQTYEAVSTLKARLNDNFEYSGTLNEDYLRSMMGIAVTGKRRELLALIRTGGTQPLHIDHEVWERLVKLEGSKQWEEKSLQGKYANSCRKTYGRTGSRGINGVRERLREKFGRSPDFDEMKEELNRDKGYGGYKKRKDLIKLEKEPRQDLSDDNSGGSPSQSPWSQQTPDDEGHAEERQQRQRATNQVMMLLNSLYDCTLRNTWWHVHKLQA